MSELTYKNLLTYKYSVYILDLTNEFTKKFLPGPEKMRQRQQVDQAARSSKQCIAEGAMQGTSLRGTSKCLVFHAEVMRNSWKTSRTWPDK